MWFAFGEISFTDIGVPAAGAGGIDRDQDFAGVHCGDREGVSGNHLRSTEAVDRRGVHGTGHMHGMMPGGDKIAGAIEHDDNLAAGF